MEKKSHVDYEGEIELIIGVLGEFYQLDKKGGVFEEVNGISDSLKLKSKLD